MTRRRSLRFLYLLAILIATACQRDQGVQASSEANVPSTGFMVTGLVRRTRSIQPMNGELIRVEMKKNLLLIRVEHGMVQTFKFDKTTTVTGLGPPGSVGSLIGKEGSELAVRWNEQDETKIATTPDLIFSQPL